MTADVSDRASQIVAAAAYLDELKELVGLHARAQGLRPRQCADVLAEIHEPAGEGPTSWPSVWTAAGHRVAAADKHLAASRLFNLARFPYVDGPERAVAHRLCVIEFDCWADPAGYERRVVDVDAGPSGGAGQAVVWVATPSGKAGRAGKRGQTVAAKPPLLVVTGGIVSIKEQWGSLLGLAGRLGMTIAVTEMPGVGENTVGYDAHAWRFYPALLDGLADVADVTQTYLLALSFSGHLALRAAGRDRRIRGIATVGAPVSAFFTDRDWFDRLPETTIRTLVHLTGADRGDLADLLRSWALTDDELEAVDVGVHYVASRRDEIIPPADPARLAALVRGARVVEFDDVHGSPGHLLDTRLWIARSLLEMRGFGRSGPAFVLGAAASLVRASRALRSTASRSTASRSTVSRSTGSPSVVPPSVVPQPSVPQSAVSRAGVGVARGGRARQ